MPEDRIKLLKFLTNFNIGGTERQFVQLVQQIDLNRFDLHVGCFEQAGSFLPFIESRGVPLEEFRIRNLYSPATWQAQWRFARYLRERQIHIVHSYGFYPNFFAVPAARLAGVPVVIASIRDTGEVLSPAKRRVQKAICRMATCVLANADAVRDRLVLDGYDAGKITVIRNGIATHSFNRQEHDSPIRREFGIPDDVPVLLAVSRLNELKGIPYLLKALPMVLERYPKVRLLVVGDGAQRSTLEKFTEMMGLNGSVVFTGFRLDVSNLLREASISVLPSLSEGLSNVLIESMAAGVPVVATDVGGNPEVVQDGVTGILVPPRNPNALARAILQMLDDPGLAECMGKVGVLRIQHRFSIDRALHETEHLYSSLLRNIRQPEFREGWT
ncbi:MAG TPA: glycosyltransferase [Terriglobia bacterium]|nr:glycosyltransferase [Terriglobia bacterium]